MRCGFISLENAKTDYQVVIRNDEVVVDETCALRKKARQNAPEPNGNGGFGFNQYRREFEEMWTLANYSALTKAISRLPVDWRFFVKHQVFSRIQLLDDHSRIGDGSEVMTILRGLAEEYPDIADVLR